MKLSPRVTACLRANFLALATVVGVLIGILAGCLINASNAENLDDQDGYTPRDIMHVKFIGELFLRMLKGIIIPLIVPTMIASVSSLDLSLSGKVGGRIIGYYVITTIISVTLGIILVSTIQPGVGNTGTMEVGTKRQVLIEDTLMDLLRNAFTDNIVASCTSQTITRIKEPPHQGLIQMTSYVLNSSDRNTWAIETTKSSNTNILGLIMFSIVFGIAISNVGEPAERVKEFFTAMAQVMMKITTWIIYLAPIGVLFLVTGSIMQMVDVADTFRKLGLYVATVLLGLCIHGFITLPILYFSVVRENPLRFFLNMGQALTTAWGTSSSSATLPVTIKCLESKNHVDPRIARFCLPIGATINMDGTALYEAVAAIFIAQIRSVDIGFGELVAISITATAASIGAAGIPQAGLITMVMVLDTIGLPSEDVALILAVDWLLDRFRTVINIWGDALGAAIVYKLSKTDLDKLDELTAMKSTEKELTNEQSDNFTDNEIGSERRLPDIVTESRNSDQNISSVRKKMFMHTHQAS